MAVTPTTQATAPLATDPAWKFAQHLTGAAASNVGIANLPGGQRIWLMGRSIPGAYDALQLASAWVQTASVDLAVLAAPTGLSMTSVGATSAVANWTVGDASLFTEVRLSQPNGQPYIVVKTLPPGSNTWPLLGLTLSTTIGIQIVHTDGAGGYSTILTTTFLTSGVDPVLVKPPTPHLVNFV